MDTIEELIIKKAKKAEYDKQYRLRNLDKKKEQNRKFQKSEARKAWIEAHKEELKEYQKQYKKNNKEHIDELMKEWHKSNPDKNKTYKKKYRAENKDILNAKNRDYYYRTIEHQKKRAKLYQQNHPEETRKRCKKWRAYNPRKMLLNSARTKAKRRGLEFNITLEDVIIPTNCPIFNIVLSKSNGRMQDHSPSLDRIDSSKGYIKGNVMVISWKANRIKNNATADELIRVGTFMKSYNYDL